MPKKKKQPSLTDTLGGLPEGSRVQRLPTTIFEPTPERATATTSLANPSGTFVRQPAVGSSDPSQEINRAMFQKLNERKAAQLPQAPVNPTPADEGVPTEHRSSNFRMVALNNGRIVKIPTFQKALEPEPSFLDDVLGFLRD